MRDAFPEGARRAPVSGTEGSSPASWRIIGIGSPVAGDDLGWLAIGWLHHARLDRHADLVTLDRPGTALLDHMQPGSQVILIDAMDADLAPGTILELPLEDLIITARPPSSHEFGLAETLALAKALGTLPHRCHVIGIQMGRWPGDPKGRDRDPEHLAWLIHRIMAQKS
jgi:hydrogenase maturation protease